MTPGAGSAVGPRFEPVRAPPPPERTPPLRGPGHALLETGFGRVTQWLLP
jgi:hypothetical protein